MTDGEEDGSASPPHALRLVEPSTIVDERQRDLGFSEELRDLLQVERERIESQNKRTEVVRLAVQMNDAADKRQFDFQMAQLSAQTAGSKRKYRFATWVSACCILISASLSAVLFFMLFWGTETQSILSLSVLKILGIGFGGYGAVGAAVRGIKLLMNSMGRESSR